MSETMVNRAQEGAGPRAETWQPQIVALVCNWCTYAGADMAGTTRRAYPAAVRTLRVPCTGRMSPLFILKAFEGGADGVLASGCHPGDCHYVQGNYVARRRFTAFRALLDFIGLDQRRLHFSWVSAAEGMKWADVVEKVTAAVREAGPLRRFGVPAAPATLGAEATAVLPPRPAAPRPVPPAAEQAAIAAHLRTLAEDLLREGKVETVLGYMKGTLPGQRVPAFVARPENAGILDWSEACHTNLAAYLAGPVGVKGKVAVVVKACDAGTVHALLEEKKIPREDTVLVGVSCPGMWTPTGLAAKCYPCAGAPADIADWTVTPEGAREGAAPSPVARPVAPDPRDAEIAYLEGLSADARWNFWQDQFADCLRCYACRAVCPMCYCGSCISDQHRPQWIPTSIDGRGNTAWNVVRAYHLAGRCAGCDECARVCPSHIRLDLVNRRLDLEMQRRFGHAGGGDGGPPLAAFRPDDPQEFIY